MKPVNFSNIPDELQEYDQWVCWRGVPKNNGKMDKIPVTPGTGINAKSNDPSTWRSYDHAFDYYSKYQSMAGVGFVFSENDPFAGFDLDDCRTPETGELTDRAKRILKAFDTYSEISPSDTGVKGFCKGHLPGKGAAKWGIELYDRGRFFTVTGARLGDYSGQVEHRQEQVTTLHNALSGSDGKGVPGQNVNGWQDDVLLPGVSGGARHRTALRLAGRWAMKGLSRAEIMFFIIAWNMRNQPPKESLAGPSKELDDILIYATANTETPNEQKKQKRASVSLI